MIKAQQQMSNVTKCMKILQLYPTGKEIALKLKLSDQIGNFNNQKYVLQ